MLEPTPLVTSTGTIAPAAGISLPGYPDDSAGAANFTQVVPPGTYRVPENPAQSPQGWYGEETLDVGAIHSMAPDVSALADPNTGMLIGQTQSFPDGSYYSEYRIGGTSLASPLFAGMMADVQARAGTDIGFANPMLYAKASAFSDILPAPAGLAVIRSDYANYVDASSGYLATARVIGYDAPLTIHAGAGYDDVTGLGTPDGQSWVSALSGS